MDEWIESAGTELADAHNREERSVELVQQCLTQGMLRDQLPKKWQLNRDLLPAATARKLKARTAAGIANPLHAYRASRIAAYDDRQMRWFAVQDERDPLNAAATNPIDDGRELTPTQEQELRDQIPFDDAGEREAPITLPAKVLRHFEIQQLHGDSGIQATHVLAVLATFFVAGFFGAPAAIGVFALFLGLTVAAEGRYMFSTSLMSADWAALEMATVEAPRPMEGTREYQLAQLSVALSRAITSTHAWKSSFLDMHRVQLDPEAEAAEIIEHATRISALRAQAGARPAGDSDAAYRAQQQYDSNNRILDTVEQSLVNRVAALYRYAAELHTLDNEYAVLQTLKRNIQLTPELEELVRQTGVDAMATANVESLTSEIEDLNAAIQAQVSVLSGDLNALKLYGTETV
ncbi:hypothetical protein ACBG85_29685 (plasmid) [Rhodococcus sp. NyZ502]|uniref:hypothetical protein n=1 Tax=Rhodococcus sp. NyZ502 TaxID=3242855 RepID=UPI003559358D